MLEQKAATPELLVQLLLDLIEKPAVHEKMQNALAQWHAPHAAEQIAAAMLIAVGAGAGNGCRADSHSAVLPVSRTSETTGNTENSGPPQAGQLQVGRKVSSKTPLLAGGGA